MISCIQFALSAFAFLSVVLVTPGLYITAPVGGAIVNGIVEIRGSIPVMNFSSAEISYAYDVPGEVTWFLIAHIDTAVQDGILAAWDTTTITDGDYQLKLSVTQNNTIVNEVFVKNLQVSNYTHADATLPVGPGEASTIASPHVTTNSNPLIPTAIPSNPASIDADQIKKSIIAGVIFGVAGVFSLLIYVAARGLRKRR